MMTTDPPALRSAVDYLVLARLAVPSRKPQSAAEVRADVVKVTGTTLTADGFSRLTAALRAEGLVEPRPRSKGGVRLTDAGRAVALEYLGVEALPSRTNWKVVRAKYLFPKALAGADASKLDTKERLGAFLIRREYGLAAGATVRQALEALVCKLVGHPNQTTLDGLFREILSAELGADQPLTKDELLTQFSRKLTGTKTGSREELQAAVLREWLQGGPGPSEAPEQPDTNAVSDPAPLDLTEFAATVKRIARDCPAGDRFGSNKVFIAAAWRATQAEDGFPRMTLAEFKAALLAAAHQGSIRLEPADLVQAMSPELVAESAVPAGGATLHFILIEEDRP